MKKLLLIALLLTSVLYSVLLAQVSMGASPTTYSQNFNTLISSSSGTWTDNSTISNWYAKRTGTGNTIAADTGSGTGGNLYSYGAASNSDRALGSLGSSNALAGHFAWGLLLKNTGTTPISSISIAYYGEQWRKSGVTVPQTISFLYKTSTTTISDLQPNTTSGWTAVSALNFSSPINTSTAAALDGNSSANRVSISSTINGLNLAVDSYMLIKWDDPDHSGSDHGLAIDDVSISWTFSEGANLPPSITSLSISPSSNIIPTTAVSVSATITDSDGSVEGASVYWGTTSGTRTNTVEMTNSSGDVWVGIIPAQGNLSTVYYSVYAIDDDGDDSESNENSYSVTAPPPPSAPVSSEESNVTTTGFTANWEAVSGATGYYLDVYTKTSGTNATDLLISEYIEGDSNNKAIEIFNGTGATIDLRDYSVRLYSNGASSPNYTYNLTGSLTDGEVYVIAHSSAASAFTSVADYTVNGGVAGFNGNDAIELYKNSTSSAVDIFGRIGENPGTEWGTSPLWTINTTLVRKSSVTGGVTTNPESGFPTLTTEWDNYAQDTASYLGSHTMAGGSNKTYVSGYENLNVNNVHTYPVTGLDPETEYFYIVRAYDGYSQTSGSSNEISVTTDAAAPIYDYPNGTVVDIDEHYSITVGGNGNANNNPSGSTSTAPNTNFTPNFVRHLTLIDAGPWNITLATTDPWVTYRKGSTWTSKENTTGTSVTFEVTASKDVNIEIQSGYGGDPTLPVELSSFTAAMNAYNNAVLTWVTQTETGVSGFYVYRNLEANLESAELISNLIPATNTSSQQVYVYSDTELQSLGTYYYWLQVSDMDGTDTFHGPITLTYDGGNNNTNPVIPTVTKLSNIFPNPFNPSTQISYSLAKDAKVRFEIFNSRGQLVRSIEAGNKAVGNYTLVWNGVDNNGTSVPTGVYYIRMHAGADSFSRKAVLMK